MKLSAKLLQEKVERIQLKEFNFQQSHSLHKMYDKDYDGRFDTNPKDVVSLDIPLFIRLLEFAKEDAQTDMDLHKVAEKAIALSSEGKILSMEDYDSLIPLSSELQEKVRQNMVTVNLNVNAIGLSKFKNIPTFKNLLSYNQLEGLKVGDNLLKVNHTVWGSLQRIVGYDSDNMSVAKTESLQERVQLEEKKNKFKKFKQNKVPLTPEEKAEFIKNKATWENGDVGVWKSVNPDTRKVTYLSNTHRAWEESPTIKGAIKNFKFIKTTS